MRLQYEALNNNNNNNNMKGHVGEMRGDIKNISKILISDNIATYEFV